MWTHLSLVVAIAAMANAPSAQSLADLAKREEARRKAIKAPAKVLTNEDLPSVPPPPPPAAPAEGAAETGTASAGSGGTSATAPSAAATDTAAKTEPATPVRDEAYWRQRMSAARDNLNRLQTFQDALQTRINSLTTDFVNRDDPAQRQVISSDRQKALAELDRVKKEVQESQTSIAATEEEARRSNVPPGWLR
jgi:hypothetical protein